MHSLGGIHPRLLIPIVVDVGCNTPSVRDDPLYIGVQQVITPEPALPLNLCTQMDAMRVCTQLLTAN